MLTLRFARRYLFSKKSHSVINLISGVSLFAIAMPVAAMVILLSVFNGFEGLIHSMTSAFDADLTITPRRGVTIPTEGVDTAALRRIEGVETLSWVVEQEALAKYGNRQQLVTVRGVEEHYTDLFPIREAITVGEYRLRQGDKECVVMGQGMTYMLGIRSLVTAPLELYALRRTSFSALLPTEGYRRQELPITGLFLLDAESESRYLLTSITLARRLFEREGVATSLLMRLQSTADPEWVKRAVEEQLGEAFRVRTRYELRPSFYDMMTYEKWGILFISLLVLVIASFSVIGALTMLIIEKRREQQTLRSLGADTRFLRRIFVGEGFLLALLGGGGGLLLGVGVTLLQQHLGLIRLPVETFIMEAYPVELRVGDLLRIVLLFTAVLSTIILLTVHTLIPDPKKRP